MSQELIPTFKDRPAILHWQGWHVAIGVKDSEYLRMLKVFKRRVFAAHPDRGGSGAKVRKVLSERRKFQLTQAKEYAEWELLPPDGFQGYAGVVERRKRLRGQK